MERSNRQRQGKRESRVHPNYVEALVFTVQQVAKMLNEALQKKLASGQCLQCECAASKQHRGLCKYHYDQFYSAKVSIKLPTKRATDKARDEFDANAVAANQILPSRRGNRPRTPNPFRIVYQQAS